MVQNVCYMLRKHELEKGLPLSRQLVLKTEELMSGYKEPDQIFLKALKKGEESGKVVLIIENIALLGGTIGVALDIEIQKIMGATT